MRFDNAPVLFLLFVFVIFIPLLIIRYRKNREGVALFAAAAASNERKSLLRELRLRMILSDSFFLLFIGFLIVALAGPSWGVRLGAVIGKGRGVLAVPLTYDDETISAFLHSLDSEIISGSGTNLESLIDAAAAAFDDSIPSRRRIIIFSDGEGLTGSFQRAVDRARREGISVSAVGLGSEQGGPVPFVEGPNAPDGFLAGQDGRVIISSRQEDVLRNGAERSGGIYIDGSRSDAARVLAGYINSLSAESRLAGNRREPNPRWQIFVLAAMTSLALSRLMGFSRKGTAASTIKARKDHVLLISLICLVFLGSCSGARSRLLILEGNFFKSRGYYTEAISSYLRALSYDNAAPYAEYGLGAAFFALEEEIAALERYKNAERSLLHSQIDHSELRYRIHYNMGIIYFEQGEYADAAQAFRDALIADGSRLEAKRNLELSLLTMARGISPAFVPHDGEEESVEGRPLYSSVLFEYLREREQQQWRSREWDGESESSGLDY